MTAPETLAERLAKLRTAYTWSMADSDHDAHEAKKRRALYHGTLDAAYSAGELITRAEVARLIAEAVEAEREGCAQVADAYCEENRQMATDTIMLDPVLSNRGGPISAADWAKAEELTITGCVHTSMFHAAQNIAAAIRARAAQTEKEG